MSSATARADWTSLDECAEAANEISALVSTQKYDPTLAQVLRVLKQTDFNVAVGIAAHANQKLRDKLGNILTDIWSRNSSDADTATGQLTSHEDIQTYMREMLQEHIATNKTLLLKCDNDTLCTWILSFVTSWEQQYKGAHTNHDISESILSVMRETVQYVAPYMRDTEFDVARLEKMYAEKIRPKRTTLPLLSRDSAVVRFYFRHPGIARYMVLIAGKLLQKRECNRNGSYCSTRQRNDVARELERVVCDLKYKVQSADYSGNTTPALWVMYALDHKVRDSQAAVALPATQPSSRSVTPTMPRETGTGDEFETGQAA